MTPSTGARRPSLARRAFAGKPKEGDARAAFAVLRPGGGYPNVEIERVRYDADAVGREVVEAGLPPEFGAKLVAAA